MAGQQSYTRSRQWDADEARIASVRIMQANYPNMVGVAAAALIENYRSNKHAVKGTRSGRNAASIKTQSEVFSQLH